MVWDGVLGGWAGVWSEVTVDGVLHLLRVIHAMASVLVSLDQEPSYYLGHVGFDWASKSARSWSLFGTDQFVVLSLFYEY